MVELLVDSEIYKFHGVFERRITYIRGDSGTGKSSLVYFLGEASRVVRIECNKGVSVIASSESNTRVLSERNKIFFMDDSLNSEDTEWFNGEVIEALIRNDSYLVIINRAEVGNKDRLSIKKDLGFELEFSMNSLYVMRNSGINHWLERYFPEGYLTSEVILMRDIEAVVTEDTYGMKSFCSSYFDLDVYSSHGKDKFLNELKSVLTSGKYKKVILFVDTACFGQYFADLVAITDEFSEIGIYLDVDYECFEYLILCSNYFNKDFTTDFAKANAYKSWEKYYEYELIEKTKNTNLVYMHGRELRPGFLLDCKDVSTCNEYRARKCRFYVDGDKISALLSETKFGYLLKLKRKKEDYI